MTDSFVSPAVATDVHFGVGVLEQLRNILEQRLGTGLTRRIFIVATPGRRKVVTRIEQLLGDRVVGTHLGAVMHVPQEVARSFAALLNESDATLVVAVGGGSATGLAKTAAKERGVPYVAIPTTYSGSEMTPIWGTTERGEKQTGRDDRVRPRIVLYDPSLTTDFPLRAAVPSALNALAHALEAVYARDASPLSRSAAYEGAVGLLAVLPQVVSTPGDVESRAALMRSAWLCGYALGTASMGLHHKLCHVLGGTFNLAHADTHAVLLPFSMAYNAPAAPELMKLLAQVFGNDEPVAALHRWVRDQLARAGAPISLASLGFTDPDVETAAQLVCSSSYPNPRPVEKQPVVALLHAAMSGL